MQLKRILAATDFSAASERALQRAALIAQRSGAELRLVHAVPSLSWLGELIESKQHWSEQVRARAATKLKQLAGDIADGKKIAVSTALINGAASKAIAGAVSEFNPDLVVVGTLGEGHNKARREGLGHTAAKVIAASTKPLLLVRSQINDAPKNVLAALDLSAMSVRVARWAQELAGRRNAAFLHAFELPFTPRLREYGVKRATLDVYATDALKQHERDLRAVLLQAGVSNRAPRLVVRGEAIRTIYAQLRKLRIDTLVIGKHSRRRRDEAVPYGSVCHYLTHYSTVDVLVIP